MERDVIDLIIVKSAATLKNENEAKGVGAKMAASDRNYGKKNIYLLISLKRRGYFSIKIHFLKAFDAKTQKIQSWIQSNIYITHVALLIDEGKGTFRRLLAILSR